MAKNNEKIMLGEFIFERRKELGFTQQELADKLSVSNKAVSKWETFETNPDLNIIVKLAEVLKVTTDELLNCCIKKTEAETPAEAADIKKKVNITSKKATKKDRVKLFFNMVFLVIFLLATIFMVVCTALAFDSSRFDTRGEQIGIIVFSTVCLFIFGIISVLFIRGIIKYSDKYTKINSKITEINGYIVFANLPKKEKWALTFRYMKEKKLWWILDIIGVVFVILTYVLMIYIIDIKWILITFFTIGCSACFTSLIVNFIQRKNWFLKQNIILTKEQLDDVANQVETETH